MLVDVLSKNFVMKIMANCEKSSKGAYPFEKTIF
jgi:hypothetical protein